LYRQGFTKNKENFVARIIMISGKGGVGKTTVAAATGLACARSGQRTLVLSFDLAHSLLDSLDISDELFSSHRGEPVNVALNLDIQEIDVQEELQRDWHGFYQYGASLMMHGGLDDVLAEEIAMMPGLDDVVALIRVNRHIASGAYDVIVLDSPPTGEALRFVGITSTLEWYVRKRLNTDQKISKFLRPVTRLMSLDLFLPEQKYFDSMKKLFEALEGIDAMLRDPAITTVRLVTNADKMVVRETQRAYMYFSMYGMTTDSIIINRLLPTNVGEYFAELAMSQKEHAEFITQYFQPAQVTSVPYLQHEVRGITRLDEFAHILFAETSPSKALIDTPPYSFDKLGDGHYVLQIKLPFVEKSKVLINRKGADLIVRLGTFKRNILLPRMMSVLQTGEARIEDDTLRIHFMPADEHVS
jgi:arsenite-transporting ATPase